MGSGWQRRKILIWGKTRPELSQKYREIVCTGGVFEDTKRLVRLYPIPLRYIDDEKVFRKYQWIEASVMRSSSDTRPESYKIRSDDIHTLGLIPSENGNWDERAKWVMQPDNICQSVEALQAKQQIDHTSLGLVKPAIINGVTAQRINERERNEFWNRYKLALSQMDLPLDQETGRVIKPLTPPDYQFQIRFSCDDNRCSGDHQFSVRDWETDALYFNLRQRGDSQSVASEKVVEKIRDQICAPDKDLYFFLGNISSHQHIFTIVGFWWPKKKQAVKESEQKSLF